MTLADDQVRGFIEDGFVHLEQIVPQNVVDDGCRVIWNDLGQSSDGPASWSKPVVRLMPSDDRPFREAFENRRLYSAFDQLVGVGRWLPRPHLGLFVVRFPHDSTPQDTAWHIDASFPPPGEPTETMDFSRFRVNITSRDRALLMLFLFSDTGLDDAPTRIRVGSHLDVPQILQPAGDEGMTFEEASKLAERASETRPVIVATGRAGDVYLCHPFLLHAAQPVRGTAPRLMAQPPLATKGSLLLDKPGHRYSPVELAIRMGLARSPH